MNTQVLPFTINVPESDILDLKDRLQKTRWPERECVKDWSQGVPLNEIKKLSEYWLNHYDWYRCQSRLNSLDNYMTNIDGLDIHFLHIKSKHESATPLLITHGWPGSVVEFLSVINPLTTPNDAEEPAFHLVIPSLPGFGFSGKPSSVGWGIEKIASVWIQLMERLGYKDYIAQGGDWGAGVTSCIGSINPPGLKAIHLNLVVPSPSTDPSQFTKDEKEALDDLQFYTDWDSGYSKQQSTRPQTIGYGLNDSPVALAAWVFEKFHFWTDKTSDQVSAVSADKILDNIMIYWSQRLGTSSARLYWESFSQLFDNTIVTVPTGVSVFPKEIIRSSRRWAEQRYTNIKYWNYVVRGGHFAALEQPELFVKELRSFVIELENAD